MRLLLDSHTLLRAMDDVSKLSPAAVTALQSSKNELLLSAATVWEIAIKVSRGKLRLSLAYTQWMNQAISYLGLSTLPITVKYADAQVALPWHHRDPFDRLIIGQALTDKLPVVSADAVFDSYGVTRLW